MRGPRGTVAASGGGSDSDGSNDYGTQAAVPPPADGDDADSDGYGGMPAPRESTSGKSSSDESRRPPRAPRPTRAQPLAAGDGTQDYAGSGTIRKLLPRAPSRGALLQGSLRAQRQSAYHNLPAFASSATPPAQRKRALHGDDGPATPAVVALGASPATSARRRIAKPASAAAAALASASQARSGDEGLRDLTLHPHEPAENEPFKLAEPVAIIRELKQKKSESEIWSYLRRTLTGAQLLLLGALGVTLYFILSGEAIEWYENLPENADDSLSDIKIGSSLLEIKLLLTVITFLVVILIIYPGPHPAVRDLSELRNFFDEKYRFICTSRDKDLLLKPDSENWAAWVVELNNFVEHLILIKNNFDGLPHFLLALMAQEAENYDPLIVCRIIKVNMHKTAMETYPKGLNPFDSDSSDSDSTDDDNSDSSDSTPTSEGESEQEDNDSDPEQTAFLMVLKHAGEQLESRYQGDDLSKALSKLLKALLNDSYFAIDKNPMRIGIDDRDVEDGWKFSDSPLMLKSIQLGMLLGEARKELFDCFLNLPTKLQLSLIYHLLGDGTDKSIGRYIAHDLLKKFASKRIFKQYTNFYVNYVIAFQQDDQLLRSQLGWLFGDIHQGSLAILVILSDPRFREIYDFFNPLKQHRQAAATTGGVADDDSDDADDGHDDIFDSSGDDGPHTTTARRSTFAEGYGGMVTDLVARLPRDPNSIPARAMACVGVFSRCCRDDEVGVVSIPAHLFSGGAAATPAASRRRRQHNRHRGRKARRGGGEAASLLTDAEGGGSSSPSLSPSPDDRGS